MAAAAVLAVGCIPGSGDDADSDAAFATTAPQDSAMESELLAEIQGAAVSVGEWRCGEVKEAIYASIATLAGFAEEAAATEADSLSPEHMTAPSGSVHTWEPDELRAALDAAGRGLSAADQQALNAACELYGQHDSALELWAIGERGDACDVWRPAHASAADASHDLNTLHPIAGHMWTSATGAVAEGHGRCIAERAN